MSDDAYGYVTCDMIARDCGIILHDDNKPVTTDVNVPISQADPWEQDPYVYGSSKPLHKN